MVARGPIKRPSETIKNTVALKIVIKRKS